MGIVSLFTSEPPASQPGLLATGRDAACDIILKRHQYSIQRTEQILKAGRIWRTFRL